MGGHACNNISQCDRISCFKFKNNKMSRKYDWKTGNIIRFKELI